MTKKKKTPLHQYQDHYFHKAKQDRYPARSVYKLKEMDAQCRLLGPGMRVLDLGAAPGSWTMAAAEKVGARGRVLSVDLKASPMSFSPQVTYLESDVFAPTPEFAAALTAHAPFDLVMSDMAPQTTGIKFTDHCRSLELCRAALELARRWLKPGGSFVVKVFMGPDAQDFQLCLREFFAKVKVFKPDSSRAASKEIFYIGLGFRGEAGPESEPREGPDACPGL